MVSLSNHEGRASRTRVCTPVVNAPAKTKPGTQKVPG